MTIVNYTPTDTDTTMYILGEAPLSEIIEKSKDKWGSDIDFDDIEISSEYIHTRCLGYDLYDSSDYDEYIVVTYV
tara:strand:+ start:350 stop:574 length:225 start_codon:yes stop_codon:yes gene_type:complete